MAVSRWERGVQEPPANIYIQPDNITGDPECWYFWAISSRDWRIVAKILWWIGRASQGA